MAAAGASILQISLLLQGVGDVVGELRRTAGQFDSVRDSVQGANDAVGQLRAQLTSGATAGQFGGLAAQFRSIGLAAEQIPEIAHEFRERLFRDPQAIGTFGRAVVPARLGGPQDETRELREAMRMLRETTDAEERLYRARRLGLEVMLPFVDAGERHARMMEEEGVRRGAFVDEELRQLRANHATQETRLQDLQAERDMIRERIALKFGNWFRDNITLPIDDFMTRMEDHLANLFPWLRRKDDQKPQEKHTEAVDRNTEALRILSHEYANAGPRARGAVPAGLHGQALQHALEAHGFALGAFSVSMGSQ